MPIYSRLCAKCKCEKEVFLKMSERHIDVECDTCHTIMTIGVTVPAKTASLWNDGWNAGLSGQGYYSPALGGYVHNERELEKIMKQRGFVSERELGSDYVEKKESAIKDQYAAQDKLHAEYASVLKENGGNKEDAMSKVFTAEKCLSGEIDKIYNTPE